ncbi:hypothetical protein C8R47DRAFT_1328903 [Mycena vitilis]|nr:hypothetical protein C8R47DRAFT_1328903 [Mycena vitilis]
MDCPPSASFQPNIQKDSVAIRGRGRTLSESVPCISPESFAKQGYLDNYIDGLSHPRAEERDDKGAGYSDNYIDGQSHPRAEERDDKGAPSVSTMDGIPEEDVPAITRLLPP